MLQTQLKYQYHAILSQLHILLLLYSFYWLTCAVEISFILIWSL